MESRSAGEKRDDSGVDDSERVTYGLIAALALAIMAMVLGGCS